MITARLTELTLQPTMSASSGTERAFKIQIQCLKKIKLMTSLACLFLNLVICHKRVVVLCQFVLVSVLSLCVYCRIFTRACHSTPCSRTPAVTLVPSTSQGLSASINPATSSGVYTEHASGNDQNGP